MEGHEASMRGARRCMLTSLAENIDMHPLEKCLLPQDLSIEVT